MRVGAECMVRMRSVHKCVWQTHIDAQRCGLVVARLHLGRAIQRLQSKFAVNTHICVSGTGAWMHLPGTAPFQDAHASMSMETAIHSTSHLQAVLSMIADNSIDRCSKSSTTSSSRTGADAGLALSFCERV